MRRSVLSEQNKTLLRRALGSASRVVFREVEANQSRVFETNNREIVAIFRFEGREMVVVALAGTNLRENRAEILNFAAQNGAVTIRFHTTMPQVLIKGLRGLRVQLLEKRERFLRRDEYIYRIKL